MTAPFGLPWSVAGGLTVVAVAAALGLVIFIVDRLPDDWVSFGIGVGLVGVLSGFFGMIVGGLIGLMAVSAWGLSGNGDTAAESLTQAGQEAVLGAVMSGVLLVWVLLLFLAWQERRNKNNDPQEVTA